MSKIKFLLKLSISFVLTSIVLVGLAIWLYLSAIPTFITNHKIVNILENSVYKSTGFNLTIDNPKIRTTLTPIVEVKFDNLNFSHQNKTGLALNNFDTEISLISIFKQKVILKKVNIENVYTDVNTLLKLKIQKQEKKKSNFKIDLWDCILNIKNCAIKYNIDNTTSLNLVGKNLRIANIIGKKHSKNIKFNFNTTIQKKNKKLIINVKDDNKVHLKDNTLYVDNCRININKSYLLVKCVMTPKDYDVDLFSRNFDINNIIKLLKTNLFIPNGKQIMSLFSNTKGTFDLDICINNHSIIKGSIRLKNCFLKVVSMGLPVHLKQGNILITKDIIKLENFKGHYCEYNSNKFDMVGTVSDYRKSIDTKITANAKITDDFMRDHLTKLTGYPLGLVGVSDTRLVFTSKNKSSDLLWLFRINKGGNLVVDNTLLSENSIERVLKTQLHFVGKTIQIKGIDYFEGAKPKKGEKKAPIINVTGNIDISKPIPQVKDIGFVIPQPVPSEFLNTIIRQSIFRKGTIWGAFHLYNKNNKIYGQGKLFAKKIKIPSQRLSIKELSILTDDDHIHVHSWGKYRKSKFIANGVIWNNFKLPLTVKTADVTVGDLNVEKILTTFNNDNKQQTNFVAKEETSNNGNDNIDKSAEFDIRNIVIQNCALKIVKGTYKKIVFGNVNADMTLDKTGLMTLKSNDFDFADGKSSGTILCDLVKQKYTMDIAAKQVNSTILAESLLNLGHEISGKSNGNIHLETDNTMKLNGYMDFDIHNGTIGKIGLLQYLLNFANIFRNPFAMISPSTLVDLVNVPDGRFEKITGELYIDNNIIKRIRIRSTSPLLSAFIIGRINLETKDSMLRIYTKFSGKNNGMYGVLRNFSLNSISNKIKLGTKTVNSYYLPEIAQIPAIADEKNCHIFIAKIDGDIEHNNFLSYLKKIK